MSDLLFATLELGIELRNDLVGQHCRVAGCCDVRLVESEGCRRANLALNRDGTCISTPRGRQVVVLLTLSFVDRIS
jgi:hypothetical protein